LAAQKKKNIVKSLTTSVLKDKEKGKVQRKGWKI
jgi:hypothetical protein